MINQPQKITIATSQPIFPPQNLHTQRIFHLYKQVAQQVQIEIISLGAATDDYFTGIIAPGLSEIRIPKSIAHRQAEQAMQQQLGSLNLDFCLLKLGDLTSEYLAALQKSAHDAIAVICDQPYLFPAVSKVSNKPIWYQATGIVSELSAKLLPENELGLELTQAIARVEQQCCQESELIITASSHTAQQITNKYSISPAKIVCLPHGVDSADQQFISLQQRLINQEKLGLKPGFLAIFICPEYSPNSEEVKIVLNIASKLPQINFLILGNIGMNFNPRLLPPNVDFISRLNLQLKSLILNTANIAINPTSNNAYSQSQMVEYFLRGVPVISTQEGVADFDFPDQQYCVVGETWQFPKLLLIAQQENMAQQESRIRRVRDYLIEKFTWSNSADQLRDFLGDQDIAS